MNNQAHGPVFDLYSPLGPLKAIISIPHSGVEIPFEFKEFLVDDEAAIGQDVDYFVHQLIDIEALRAAGYMIIKSHIHRACIDLNRAQDIAVLNWKKNSHGQKLVETEPSDQLVKKLIAKYYIPYFETITSALVHLEDKNSFFIDLHSMPSKATDYHLKQNPNQKIERPSFCLSDYNGKTCKPSFINQVQKDLSNFGNTTINDPYIGGYITQHFGNFDLDNIQIEINRALYMNEVQKSLNADTSKLRNALTEMFLKLIY